MPRQKYTGDGPNPSGLCACGCGEKTPLAPQSDSRRGWIIGQPIKFILGHKKKHRLPNPNPSGLCMCGCGEPTSIAARSDKRYGAVAGFPVRFVNGHSMRMSPHEYLPEDRGYPNGPCWIWQRGKTSNGYGSATNKEGSNTTAHRVVYERLRGPIPDGLVLDHLCRQRDCVNPDHLEPVTSAENVRRGEAPVVVANRTGQCLRGHPFTPENTHTYPNGRRECKMCRGR